MSPTKIKRQNTHIKIKARQGKYRKNCIQQREKLLRMKLVLAAIKQKYLLSEHALDHLEKSYDTVPRLILKRCLKNVKM